MLMVICYLQFQFEPNAKLNKKKKKRTSQTINSLILMWESCGIDEMNENTINNE